MRRWAFGETIKIVRPTSQDDGYDGKEFVWSSSMITTVYGCAIVPYQGEELDRQARQGQLESWTVFAPHNVDVDVHDRVEARGKTFYVLGPPRYWQSPLTGTKPGVQFDIERVDG